MEKNTISLQIVNPKAAGIDVGSRMHVVAVDQNVDNVRSYGVYTKDHLDMIEYLRRHEISTVAMESTGSYWQTLFSALQNSVFEVILVSEHYSTQRIMADKEKFREKRLKQVQKNIHNLKLSQDELNQLMQRCLLQV